MLKIIICHDGHHVSDFHVMDYVDSVFYEYDYLGRQDLTVRVSNQIILDAFTLRLLEEKFPADEIQFFVDGVQLVYDPCFGLCEPDNISNLKIGTWETITDETLRLMSRNLNRRKGIL